MREPKKTGTPKITCTRFLRSGHQKNNTTPDDRQKLPNRYRTTSSPMTDFHHSLAKNHARNTSIKPKYSSGPRPQSRRAPWRCAMIWLFAGNPTRQVMYSAINIIISMDIDDDMMDDAVSQNSTIGWFEYCCWFEYFLNALNFFGMHGRWFLVFTSPKAWHNNQPKDHNFLSVSASSSILFLQLCHLNCSCDISFAVVTLHLQFCHLSVWHMPWYLAGYFSNYC